MRTIRPLLSAGLLLAFSPAFVFAASLVSWLGDSTYISATTVNGQGLASGAVAFSATSERNPTVGAAYSGLSAVYYGGAATTGTSSGINLWQVQNDSANFGGKDVFTFRVSTAAVGAAGYALQLWNQADFLAGSTGNVTATGFSVDARIAGSGISGEVRFVVVSNGTTLISSGQSFNAVATSTLSLTNLFSVSWFNYNPSVSMAAVGSAYDTTGFAFDNVTSVGLLVKQQRDSGSTANMSAFWDNVSITGTVAAVPEPSSYALLAGFAGLGWVSLRRRPSARR